MNRMKFLNKLDQKYQSLNIANEHGDEFKRFCSLNERNPELMTEAEKVAREDMRGDFALNNILCEKYYLWHLLKHFGTKWRGQTVDDIVKYYYTNSVMIKELLDD